MTNEFVILVDESDKEIGLMEKMEAHRKGVLHRAFSVCLFNSKGQMLIQRRSLEKYHSPGLWTNTCCSHPRKGETTIEAAHRRLVEEMGIETELDKAFSFVYKTRLGHGLIEHEYDHVFTGRFDGEPTINSMEVQEWKYLDSKEILLEIKKFPELWTEWFKIIMPKIALYYSPSYV